MKLTKTQIRQLIKEELRNVLNEQAPKAAPQSLEDRIKKLETCLQKQCPPGPGRSDPKKGYWRPPPKGHPLYGQEGVQCDEDGYCILREKQL